MKRLQERVMRFEQTAGVCMMAALFVIVNVGILTRYIFGHPIFWIEEASNFLFIWFGFLACSSALAQNRHIMIDFFVHPLPRRIKSAIQLTLGLMLQVMFLCMVWPSINVIGEFTLSSALRIPEGYIFTIVPISFALFSFHNLLAIVRDLKCMRGCADEGGADK
jgi:TRAP-type C4-dicarboxylate transport system permease small subunit